MSKNAMVPGILCMNMQNLEVLAFLIDEMEFYAKDDR